MTNEHPIDKRVREQLATLGERGRAASAAAWAAWSDAHPHKTCTRCAGKGCYAETLDGLSRRPFDHRDFDSSRERFVCSCTECRGLGSVPTTHEAQMREHEQQLDEARAEYRQLRAEICALRDIDATTFDRIARRHLSNATPGPNDWVAAARLVKGIYL